MAGWEPERYNQSRRWNMGRENKYIIENEQIYINIPVEELSETLVNDILAEAEESEGNTKLYFCIISPDNTGIDLYSTKFKVTVTRHFLNILERDNLTYTINK